MISLNKKAGLFGWMAQRITAVLMVFYLIFLLSYFFCHEPITYLDWHHLFSKIEVKFFSLITLFGLLIHAWIGIWTIITDYIHCVKLQNFIQKIVLILLCIDLGWGVFILWSFS